MQKKCWILGIKKTQYWELNDPLNPLYLGHNYLFTINNWMYNNTNNLIIFLYLFFINQFNILTNTMYRLVSKLHNI